MAEPTKKNTEIERLIDNLSPSKKGRTKSIKSNICAWCSGEASNFRDTLSKKEFKISGLCQNCQDETFGR